jgi:RHS repeat-associated protein
MTDGVSIEAEDYSFDRTGNISQPDGGANYHAITDQLLGRTNGAGRDSLVYDHAGNMVEFREASGTTWAYGYDALDRLVSVRRNGTLIARYAYDVLGRRIVKRVYSELSGGDSAYTRFVYRGSHVGFETDSAGTIGLTYTWGAGTDQLLAITDGATHYYATTDRLGSVRSLAKRDGTWALTQRFSPYGTRMSRDTSASYGLGMRLRYGWTGREWDAETEFSYHRARYVDPEIRRWIQEDPIGYEGGVNLYSYVEGSALEARDPDGLEKEDLGYVQRVADILIGGLRTDLGSYCGLEGLRCTSTSGVAASSAFGNLANSVWREQQAGLRTGNDAWTRGVRDCRAASRGCEYMASEIVNRGITVSGTILRNSLSGTNFRDGRTRFTDRDGSAVITIDPAQFSGTTQAYKRIGIDAPMTIVTVIGHELGHVYGQSELHRAGDRTNWCDEACARHYENIVRMDINAGYRDPYDAP